METTTERVDLTAADVRKLRAHVRGLQDEMKVLRLAGLDETPKARELQAEADAMMGRVEAWMEQVRKEEAARHRQEMARQAELDAAKERNAKELEAATLLLEEVLADVASIERSELEEVAKEEGISSATLLSAASAMGLKRARRYQAGGKLGGPEYWARGFLAGFGGIGAVGT